MFKFLSALSLLKELWDAGATTLALLFKWLRDRQTKKDKEKIDTAIKEATEPKREGESPEDVLKRKAKAGCEIEKMVNPNSTCDTDLNKL